MIALVTGGGGFLGSAIVRRLVARGDQVRSLARSRYPELKALGVEQSQGDIADSRIVAHAVEGCDVVFHTAAKAGLGGKDKDYDAVNVQGTGNILEACRHFDVQRMVFTSSPSVVFNGKDMEGVDESVPYPTVYEAPYPKSKARAEQMVRAANGPGLATVSLRPHLIWGPGDNHLVPRILERGRKGKLRRIGTEDKLIDSTYIDNAADAHLLAADKLAPGSPIAGKVYFISNGEPWPIWKLVDAILAASGQGPVKQTVSLRSAHIGAWITETMHNLFGRKDEPQMTRFLVRELSTAHWFDIGAAKRDLSYRPKVTIKEGLKRLAESLAPTKA